MADVENPTETIISKTVETKVEDDGTVVTEETTVIEINGDHKAETKDEEVISAKVDSEDIKTSDEQKNGETVKEEPAEEKPTGTEAADVTSETENAAAVEEVEQKEQSPPKVILHQYPPGKSSPSLSNFCLKLETFLRSHKIPYENQYSYKAGRKGKVPWIEYKGERKTDSGFIIDYLNEKFELNIDSDLSAEQKALGRTIVSMVEDRTYFVVLYHRFIENYSDFKRNAAPSGLGYSVAMKMQQRKVRSYLDGQGLGRHSKEEIYQIAHEDVNALSTLLGTKDFLLGDTPSSYDCAVFGLYGIILFGGEDVPLAEYIKENASNITPYCERMKELYWADWSDMILGDKPEPALKKGFSFRKKKAPKIQKTKEAEEKLEAEEDETAPTEETKEESTETPTTTPTSEKEPETEEPKTADIKIEEVKKTENIDTTKAEEATTNEE